MNGRMNGRHVAKLLAVSVIAAGCFGRGPRIEQLGPDPLFQQGADALARRKWSDAILAFNSFSLRFPTHGRVAEARFRLGEAYFGKKEYITAAGEFDRLANDFPAGPWADDARFKVCESYSRLSPKPPLDQEYTRGALNHCLSLETYYPNSDLVPRAKEIAVEMLNRLADKEFGTGEYYYKRGAYDSGIVYFESTVREFPTTKAAPRALLRLFQTYTTLGYKEEAEAVKARLLKDYPESEQARSLATPVAKSL
jgi:outer membrane protein assembly factor BamD